MSGRVGRRGAKSLFAVCLGSALAAGLCGCAIVGERYVLEQRFNEAQVQEIRHGKTTKKDVLDRLGPPSALAREGMPAAFPAQGPGKGQIVYRYDASELVVSEFCAYGQYGGGCIPGTPVLKMRQLWILVDERTGLVVNHKVDDTERQADDAGIRPWLVQ